MNKIHRMLQGWLAVCLGVVLGGAAALPAAAQTDGIVRAILFYSPNCGHCHMVIEDVLMPLNEQYGERLQIIGVNISEPAGRALYQETIFQLAISENRTGVPTLVVADRVMVGSGEIPEQFPGLVETYLAEGGTSWPAIPALEPVLVANGLAAPAAETDAAAAPEGAAPAPALSLESAAAPLTVWDRIRMDPVGNGLSIALLLVMIIAFAYAAASVVGRLRLGTLDEGLPRALPLILLPALVGVGVSLYMAYVEVTQTAAVCGPVGDCNAVQQSPYASLFGLIPIGLLGVVGYLAIGAAALVAVRGRGGAAGYGLGALRIMALFGLAFSIYLTFLEPFVIGATCAWCLTSAVVMMLICVLSLWPGERAPAAVGMQPARG